MNAPHRNTLPVAAIFLLFSAALLLPLLASVLAPPPLSAQPFDQRLFSEMRWRSIGPYRAGQQIP